MTPPKIAETIFEKAIAEHYVALEQVQNTLGAAFARLVSVTANALREGRKILFFGNGGSASDAQHLATELVVRYQHNRRALPAIALNSDVATLTAIGNDFGYEQVFSRQIEALGQAGDVAIGISTSGRSPNVIRGLQQAKTQGLVAAAFGGGEGGELPGLADPLLIVPSPITARIQEMHIMLGQMLCEALECELGLVSAC